MHCTATVAGKDLSARDIDSFHRQRGFNSIGYHFIIRLDGRIEQGRPLIIPGAHCRGKNSDSIGIAYVGGLDTNNLPADTRTPEQRSALRELLKQLKQQFPKAEIHGHHDFANKACPCFNATNEYSNL